MSVCASTRRAPFASTSARSPIQALLLFSKSAITTEPPMAVPFDVVLASALPFGRSLIFDATSTLPSDFTFVPAAMLAFALFSESV